MSLVLASASETRAHMLRQAGVQVEAVPSSVDEDALKREHAGASPRALAEILGTAKAAAVARNRPGNLVLGSDQVLVHEGQVYSKARDRDEARANLRALRGKTHTLVSSAVLMRGDALVWQDSGEVHLTMRAFSDIFLDRYLAEEGDALFWSVGSYRVEGLGAQLFERIEGDFFSVLGLPLIKVLSALRREGVLTE